MFPFGDLCLQGLFSIFLELSRFCHVFFPDPCSSRIHPLIYPGFVAEIFLGLFPQWIFRDFFRDFFIYSGFFPEIPPDISLGIFSDIFSGILTGNL